MRQVGLVSRTILGRLGALDRVQVIRPVQPPQLSFSEILHLVVVASPDLSPDLLADHDLARRRFALNAAGDVDAVAVDVAFRGDHVARMDSDPEESRDRTAGCQALELRLQLERGSDRFVGAVEIRHRAVAQELHEPAFAATDHRAGALLKYRDERHGRALVTGRESREPDDVGEPNGGESFAAREARGGSGHEAGSYIRRCGESQSPMMDRSIAGVNLGGGTAPSEGVVCLP